MGALGHWPWPRHMLARNGCFFRCRALRSRASPKELKARKKLKNLEFCQHAVSAKFDKAIPVRTRAPTHSDDPTTLAPCVVPPLACTRPFRLSLLFNIQYY